MRIRGKIGEQARACFTTLHFNSLVAQQRRGREGKSISLLDHVTTWRHCDVIISCYREPTRGCCRRSTPRPVTFIYAVPSKSITCSNVLRFPADKKHIYIPKPLQLSYRSDLRIQIVITHRSMLLSNTSASPASLYTAVRLLRALAFWNPAANILFNPPQGYSALEYRLRILPSSVNRC